MLRIATLYFSLRKTGRHENRLFDCIGVFEVLRLISHSTLESEPLRPHLNGLLGSVAILANLSDVAFEHVFIKLAIRSSKILTNVWVHDDIEINLLLTYAHACCT